MKSQREVFLASEGDAWFRRNQSALAACEWGGDEVCRKIDSLHNGPLSILEIGCGDGSRLQHLARSGGHCVSGIDPSAEAVAMARARGVTAVKSTADQIPFDAASFDVVVFGFCLYLCDDADLFRIAAEADRVLRTPGWLLILDFDTPATSYRPYHHYAGIQSRKMDNKSIFAWHPAYTLASLDKFHHSTHAWTDDPDEWVSLVSLRNLVLR